MTRPRIGATVAALACAICLVPVHAARAAGATVAASRGVDGSQAVLAPGTVVILANVPGIAEPARFAVELASEAAAASRSVTLALASPPVEERGSVDAYLRSDGSASARAALLAQPSWRRGAAGTAELEILDWVRARRAAGGAAWLALIDSGSRADGSPLHQRQERERRMAAALLDTIRSNSGSVLVALVDEGQARLVRDTGSRPPLEPMGYLVWRETVAGGPAVLSLAPRYPSGTAWRCTSGDACGVVALRGNATPGAAGITLGGDAARPFSGTYQLTSATPARPVAP